MTTSQKKVTGIIMMAVAAFGLILGCFGAMEVYDTNSQMAQMDSAMGGMLSSMGSQMGVATEASYGRAIAFIAVSLVLGFIGFKLLGGKKDESEVS